MAYTGTGSLFLTRILIGVLCRMLSSTPPNAQKQKRHTLLHKAPAEDSNLLGYVMCTKQRQNAVNEHDTRHNTTQDLSAYWARCKRE